MDNFEQKYTNIKENFEKYYNADLIYENNGEFLLSIEIDVSTMPEYQRDILSVYDPSIFLNLANRLRDYLNNKYLSETTFLPLNKQFKVEKINNSNDYRRIYYYTAYDPQALISKKTAKSDPKLIKLGIFPFSSTPNEKDVNVATTRSIITTTDDRFKDWYLYSFIPPQNEQSSNIRKALDGLLASLNKKGVWVSSSQDNTITDYVKKNISQTSVNDDFNKTVSQLDDEILAFYALHLSTDSSNTSEFLFDEQTSFDTGISVYYNTFSDPSTSSMGYTFAFPKKIIERFPDLSFATDIKPFKIETTVVYNGRGDIQSSIGYLKNTILIKNKSLSDLSLSIKNYDIQSIFSDLDKFTADVFSKIELQKVDPDSKFTFDFGKTKCEQPTTNTTPEENKKAQAIYKKCLEDFSDGQTNLILGHIIKVGDKDTLKHVSSTSIDNRLAAYLFVNSKNIVNVSNSYPAKNFFSKLIYAKTKFDKSEGLPTDTFYTAAKTSLQQSFVSDVSNTVKYSKIRQNIQTKFANKSINQIIYDILTDIRNLKSLYESILYRYDLKDAVEEAIKCTLAKHPELNAAVIAAEKLLGEFLSNLMAVIKSTQELSQVLTCFGPEFVGIVPGNLQISKEKLQQTAIAVAQKTTQIFTDIDVATTTVIKCFNQFVPEAKEIIDLYIKNKEAAKLLKQQYDLLVIEAKTYKKPPGTKDSAQQQINNKAQEQKTFLEEARDNAWVLLQKQAEQFAEQQAKEIAIQTIKAILSDVSDCTPAKPRPTNVTALAVAGDLNLSGNLDGEVGNLMNQLSSLFDPDKLCSLIYGSASDDLYEKTLNIIKLNYPQLYSTAPVKVNGIIVSTEAISSVFLVKEFFASLISEVPSLTAKCDQYLNNLSNNPLPIDDQEKCIDFSKDYAEKKKKELISKGFTPEQADKILENEKKLQSDKYQELQKLSNVGVYNEISNNFNSIVYPVADIAKEKIEQQLQLLAKSFDTFITAYKKEILNFIDLYFDKTLSAEKINVSGNKFIIDNIIIDFYAQPNNIYSMEPSINISVGGSKFVVNPVSQYEKYFDIGLYLSDKIPNSFSCVKKQSQISSFTEDTLYNYCTMIYKKVPNEIDNFKLQQFNKEKILFDVKQLISYKEQ